jgi:signal transduction histidine kinase
MRNIASNYVQILVTLWATATLLMGLSWWHVMALNEATQVTEIHAAERDLANLTRVSQEHAIRTFRGADQVIRFVQSRYLEIGDKLNLTELTQKGVIDAEIFPQVGVINDKGIYILANLPVNGKLDLSDREHFKVHVAADTGELFVSKPVLGRASGKWSIQLTRRITRANGDFAGVVVVSISAEYFTRFYGELKLGQHGVIALYGMDGVARVRRVGDKNEFGASVANSPLIELLAKGQLEGSYTSRSVVDGVERLYYYRKIPGYPLFVVDGLDTVSMLATSRSSAQALYVQAMVVSALIIALALALTRYLRQLRREIGIRQRAQQQVEERNEQLNAIFDLSPDGFVSFDAQHRVKYVSPAFQILTGLGDEVLEGLDERDFSAWLAQHCAVGTPFIGVAALRAQVLSGKPDKRDLIELELPGRRILQVGLRCSSTSSTSQVSQILYLRDVTLESEVDHMKSEFLATAAHELRTPMASILGFSEILIHEDFDLATQREFLDTIHTQSKLMANILNELLDLARIEARRDKEFRYTQVDLQELLADIVKGYQLPAGRSAPELELPSQHLFLMADAGKLRQALLNVISNAYKYSPQGGSVQVKAWVQDESDESPGVCIEITDHGIGLSPEQLKRVCERFYRADTSGKILGTGLGMSIVKEIIELHRGQLTFTSVPGQGTTVRLRLPAYFTLQDSLNAASQTRRLSDTRPADFS